MADDSAFEFLCERLEQASSLDRLAARGTVRLALKQAGLEPARVRSTELIVIVERVLPGELQSRGVEDAPELCRTLAEALTGFRDDEPEGSSPEEVFARLGG